VIVVGVGVVGVVFGVDLTIVVTYVIVGVIIF
jgi:hypothetical protein